MSEYVATSMLIFYTAIGVLLALFNIYWWRKYEMLRTDVKTYVCDVLVLTLMTACYGWHMKFTLGQL